MDMNKRQQQGSRRSFQPTRTVCSYGDDSTLIYLKHDKRYVWQRQVRQEKYRGAVSLVDVPIDAASDHEAMCRVRKIVDAEMWGGGR